MTAYYNEFDPVAAEWLRNLIAAGLIADGDVDERSIHDVQPSDIDGYTQCHFFAGIGVWSHALRLTGWPDDRPVWTGSAPCQPFSAAGRGRGTDDPRHLWPEFFRLIAQCRPVVAFGEQVASKDGLAWLDGVSADLEGAGYSCGAVDTCAAGFGAPHIRQRLYWVADSEREHVWRERGKGGGAPRTAQGKTRERERSGGDVGIHGATDRLGDTTEQRPQGQQRSDNAPRRTLADVRPPGLLDGAGATPGPTNGFWRDADWLLCRDGRWRAVEPGTQPLAHGATSRVGRLRAYGNSLNASQAAGFVSAYMEVTMPLLRTFKPGDSVYSTSVDSDNLAHRVKREVKNRDAHVIRTSCGQSIPVDSVRHSQGTKVPCERCADAEEQREEVNEWED